MEKDILRIVQTLLEEFRAQISALPTLVPRQYAFPEVHNMIRVAIGMRRSGKTYFLFQTIRQLLTEGIPLERILYVNFEDDRILPLDYKTMGEMIDAWYTLYPEHHEQCCYLFVDEVQNVDDWSVVLRRLLDTKKIQIYVTGSSSKLLSKEIATSLRGRSIAIEILPYNYTEFLCAHALPPPEKPVGRRMLDHQRKFLLDYFSMGGFPGVQEMLPTVRLEMLQSYVETVIFRDIVERHHITNVTLLKYFIYFLLKNSGAPFSINKFYNHCKSQGHKVGKDTLYSYLDYLEDAFLVFSVPLFTESLRRMELAPKKIYAIDPGLVCANTFNVSTNTGKLFENHIYLTLRRQGKSVFYYITNDGYEIDFVTKDKQGSCELIQVVWDGEDPATLEREKRALKAASEELHIPGKLIDWETFITDLAGNSPR